MSIPQVRALSASAALLLTAAGIYLTVFLAYPQPAQAQTAPTQTRPQAEAPQLTLFEESPSIFSSPQEAIRALDSPDILMRRSGVEWLGRWTYTYTTYGIASDKAACAQLYRQVGIVPKLARAVREMPLSDSQQAARLLTVVGPSAQSAIPAVCDALVEQGSQDLFKRYEMMNSLIHLCGGPSQVALKLTALMQDPEPGTRRAAAGAAGLCDDIGFNHIGPPPTGAIVLSSIQSPVENIKFRACVMPALTRCVDDPVTSVRLAALKSLEALTYGTSDACLITYVQAFDSSWQKKFDALWQTTLPPLARAVASQDPAVRLAALKVLAYVPADVSPLAASLRSKLHGSKEEQSYALAALCDSALTNREATLAVFLKDLSSSDLLKRRKTISDLDLMVMPLWNGGFSFGKDPLPHWENAGRLFALPASPPATAAQVDREMQRRQTAQELAQPRLLAALVQAVSDPDQEVRADTVSSLAQIGDWAAAASAHGFLFSPKDSSELTVKKALAQASTVLKASDPVAAERLQNLNAYLHESQPWFLNDSSKKGNK